MTRARGAKWRWTSPARARGCPSSTYPPWRRPWSACCTCGRCGTRRVGTCRG
ncbi:hypothetical protein BU14_0313s0008 [Porphyra umbilicalis]|uniref:Uncharacterized protein n=1 Tax=Porphyra umbilicalis TaxID=2786 RepID=A0A1X6P050_PORUM|nr:hypothetical protein BU14_0313s0008 [Porphyra umbilicalis]|eukprot:OSX74023.1 hypothetical protein BU14_0313s0008 [Porphyra umbilicalis]